MRVFITVLLLIFSLQSWTKADDIKDFEIEGITIGDNIYKTVYEDVINYCVERLKKAKVKPYKGDTTFILCSFGLNQIKDQSSISNIYDFIRVHYKKENNLIYHLSGGINFGSFNMDKCIKKLKVISNELDKVFVNAERNETEIYDDKYNEGRKIKQIAYKTSDYSSRVICYDSTNYTEYDGPSETRIKLNVQLGTAEFWDFVEKSKKK